MTVFPAAISPSIGKIAGFLSSGVVGVVLGRFARGSATPRSSGRAHGGTAESSDETSRASDRMPFSPALLHRMRTGRLPLPRRVAELTPDDEPSLAVVNALADRLAELPLSGWLDVGRSLVENASVYAHREMPYAILEATINARGLAVASWYARDAIETSAYYAGGTVPRWTSMDRRAFAAAHAAAEEAALAVLAREWLSAEDFRALCSPFAELVRESMPFRGFQRP